MRLADQQLADREWYLEELYIDWRSASGEAEAAYAEGRVRGERLWTT
jgi:hypothetical protein